MATQDYTLKDLKHEFRLTSDGDKWGNAMHWLFCLADEMHFRRDAMNVPAEWQFKPSPFGPDDEDEYVNESLSRTPTHTLEAFGALIYRYCDKCRAAGLDY